MHSLQSNAHVLSVVSDNQTESFVDSQERNISYQDYDPGELPEYLCQRFSDLPQFAQASGSVKQAIWGLKYANVIGIFLGGKFSSFLFPDFVAEFTEKLEHLVWIDEVLSQSCISQHDVGVEKFRQFGALVKLLRHAQAHDRFDCMYRSDTLEEEALQKSDCKKLLDVGIVRPSDLAQTSVEVLAHMFDDLALQRISTFLAKRNLSFGMNLRLQFGHNYNG